jgi:ATP-binding cassette, subfamily C, bacteriocin exporter
MAINQGEMVALLGEVGSGKSVLLQVLQKFQQYEEGSVIVNGTFPLENIDAKEWRETVGVVPQDVKIFNSTLIENIVLGNVLHEGEQAVETCKRLGFDKYFENFPQGYLTIVGEEGINLSGGQKQLVALARALFRKPSLLLLDEATSAMDSKTEQFVLDLLENLKSEMSILMITHRRGIAEQADKVYELADGTTIQVK